MSALDISWAGKVPRTEMGLPAVMARDIVAGVCTAFKLEREQLLSRSRLQRIVYARNMVCWLLHKRPKLNGTFRSYPEIGRAVNLMEHSSAIHAVRRCEQVCAAHPEYAQLREVLAWQKPSLVHLLPEHEFDRTAAAIREARRKAHKQAVAAAIATSLTKRGEGVADDDLDARNRAGASILLLAALNAARVAA